MNVLKYKLKCGCMRSRLTGRIVFLIYRCEKHWKIIRADPIPPRKLGTIISQPVSSETAGLLRDIANSRNTTVTKLVGEAIQEFLENNVPEDLEW